jgi:translation initiation factor 5A
MNDDGDTKDDVRMPDGEIGEKINKLFRVDEKDTSKLLSTEVMSDQLRADSNIEI